MIHTNMPRNCLFFLLLCKLTRSAIVWRQKLDSTKWPTLLVHDVKGKSCIFEARKNVLNLLILYAHPLLLETIPLSRASAFKKETRATNSVLQVRQQACRCTSVCVSTLAETDEEMNNAMQVSLPVWHCARRSHFQRPDLLCGCRLFGSFISSWIVKSARQCYSHSMKSLRIELQTRLTQMFTPVLFQNIFPLEHSIKEPFPATALQ